jgi:outer membrane receptor protein involved in Fe transport
MNLFKKYFSLTVCVLIGSYAMAQFKVSGVVKDKTTREPLIGAAVVVKGKTTGATTDIDGKFSFTIPGTPPAIVVASFLGYGSQEFTITSANQQLNIRLGADEVLMKEVKIVGSRVSDKIKESPVTIERLGIQEIKQTPAIGFYEGLGNLKGVDMTSASLGFKVINTRGFNSTSPVRTLQLIDGMDNQAPGLNFSLGNFVGASELDIEKVDIVVGANSATYGPNAFNGVIAMTTKDPYKYQGLSILAKRASRNLVETGIRFANVADSLDVDRYKDGFYKNFAKFNNKVLAGRFAYKLNAYYLNADDWEARNYSPTLESQNQTPNDAAGYDAVNIYGESRYGSNTAAFDPTILPGTQGVTYVYRTGYKEESLTNYNTNSLKLQGGLYYKIPKLGTLSFTNNYGTGTTVYQGDNRYSIKNIEFNQMKAELAGKNYFIRAYETTEDAGDSYDLVFTATKLLERQKPDGNWYSDFVRGYRSAYRDSGFTAEQSLRYARQFADSPGTQANVYGAYLQPGTPEFEEALKEITSGASFENGGTRFQDESSLRHIEGQYRFTPNEFKSWLPEKAKIGANYRRFDPNSNGTIFSDTLNVAGDISQGFAEIKTYEYGAYINFEKDIKSEYLKFIGSLRYDDHVNFDPFFTPSGSLLWSPNETDRVRLTFTQASRFPTLQDQYLLYDIGIAKLKGNIEGTRLILPENYFGIDGYLGTLQVEGNDLKINPVKPEKVRTAEIGYKGVLMKDVFIDASYYYSEYTDFLGYIIGFVVDSLGVDNNGNARYKVEGRPTRVAANSDSKVFTQGFSLGLNYYIKDNWNISGNYTFSQLVQSDPNDPLIPFFNTPEHKYNVGFGMKDYRSFGFNINYKWVDSFEYFGSPQFSGPVNAYGLLDLQVNYTFKEYNTRIKAGSSNILDNQHYEAYGAPLIGRLVYLSLNYDFNNIKAALKNNKF